MGRATYPKTKILDAIVNINIVGAVPGNISNLDEVVLFVRFGAGTSAGAVVLESASDKDYTGAWAIEGTATWSAASKEHSIRVTGKAGAWRARVSVAIVGGSVDAWFFGQ